MLSPKPARGTCVVAGAEPVDEEDGRRGGHTGAHGEPVAEVVAHVVAAEGSMAIGSRRSWPTAWMAAAVVSEP